MSSTRLYVSTDFSDNSDFSHRRSPYIVEKEKTTNTKRLVFEGVNASTSGTTLDLSSMTTITQMIIVNQDTTNGNYCLAKFYVQLGTQGADDFDFAADDTPETITDNSANGTFVTNRAAAGRWVRVSSAEDSNNDGVYLIDSTTTDVITLAAGGGALGTDNAQDTMATLSFESLVEERISAEEPLVTANVVVAGDLVLTADSADLACDVIIYGT